ncbi:hypothetical protein BDB01DRAFT_773669 [Pilobolus umbonatus]|nr:hypothetical protein BDB01DRAFT_773669 [Pilobolus umbonatus]
MENQTRKQTELSNDNEYLRQKISAIQLDNSNYGNTQIRLETLIYSQEQEITRLGKEIQVLTKAKKDAEKKLSSESQEFENDRLLWQQREADLYNQLRTLSISEPRTPRTPRRRSVTANSLNVMSPFTSNTLGDIGENEDIEESKSDQDLLKPTFKLASIDSSYAREAKIAQRTIKAQDKLILDLKNELEMQKTQLQENRAESQLQSLKIVHLEHEIANVKQVNRSLMEDNESYQILLHEKTINGEFMMNPIMQVEDTILQTSTSSSSSGLNLAAELNMASDWQKAEETDQTIRKLNDDIKTLQDTNRALQLYMNKILMKIIDNKQLEDVLSIDQPKPKEKAPVKAVVVSDGPSPMKSTSTVVVNKSHPNRQRRRTISYWGTKVPPPPAKSSSQQEIDLEDKRRHSSILSPPQPEKSLSSTINGGWAKALRRMSGIGWPVNKDDMSVNGNNLSNSHHSTSVNNDSAVGSLSGEEEGSLEVPNKGLSSGASTPSVRRSNELGTLEEE